MRKLLLVFVTLIVSCNAQINGYQSITLSAPIPPALSNLSLTIVGGLGQSTYYYHIVANYPIGHITSKGFRVVNAPTTISSSNYIQLNWNPLPGATTYDILRTTVPGVFTQASSGTCSACVVVQGVTATTYNDQSPTLSTGYTLNAPGAPTISLFLNNQDFVIPVLYLNTQGVLTTVQGSFRVYRDLDNIDGHGAVYYSNSTRNPYMGWGQKANSWSFGDASQTWLDLNATVGGIGGMQSILVLPPSWCTLLGC